MTKKKQYIKCLVDTCIYNNCDKTTCSLNEINVGCCSCNSPNCKEDTVCNSFKEKKSN